MSNEAVSCKVVSATGATSGSLSLSPAVFGTRVLAEFPHAAVRWQRAKARAGTHSVLTRSNMKGGAKKPFKQKGTGRARAGSSISPVWVGGAVVHGPTPRDYTFSLNRRTRKLALAMALSDKVAGEAFLAVDGLDIASGKTQDAVKFLKSVGAEGKKTLVIVPGISLEAGKASESVVRTVRALRNLTGVEILPVGGVNVYSIVDAAQVVCAKEAVAELEARCSASAKS